MEGDAPRTVYSQGEGRDRSSDGTHETKPTLFGVRWMCDCWTFARPERFRVTKVLEPPMGIHLSDDIAKATCAFKDLERGDRVGIAAKE